MARQGVIAVLERGLHRETGHVPRLVRDRTNSAMILK